MNAKNLSRTVEFEFDEIWILKKLKKDQIFQNLHKCVKRVKKTIL
jgi:hypothetical protein